MCYLFEKQINLKTAIQALESSIVTVEDFLSEEDFKDFCDAVMTAKSIIQQ